MAKHGFSHADRVRVQKLDMTLENEIHVRDCGTVFELSTGSNYSDSGYGAGGGVVHLPASADCHDGWHISFVNVDHFHHAVTGSTLEIGNLSGDTIEGGLFLIEHSELSKGSSSDSHYLQAPYGNTAVTVLSASVAGINVPQSIGFQGSHYTITKAGDRGWLLDGVMVVSGSITGDAVLFSQT